MIDKTDAATIARSQGIAADYLAQADGFVDAITTAVYETDAQTGERRFVEGSVTLEFKYRLRAPASIGKVRIEAADDPKQYIDVERPVGAASGEYGPIVSSLNVCEEEADRPHVFHLVPLECPEPSREPRIIASFPFYPPQTRTSDQSGQ